MLKSACLVLVLSGVSVGCEVSNRDWDVELVDTGSSVPDDPAFGLGLDVHLSLRHRMPGRNSFATPTGVLILSDDPDAIDTEIVGLRAQGSAAAAVEVIITPRRPGINRVRILSDDTDDVAEIIYRAVAPSSFEFVTKDNGSTDTPDGIVLFSDSQLEVSLRYAADGERLIGRSPLTVLPADSPTVVDEGQLFAGSLPHMLTLRAEVLGAQLPVEVVDGAAIDAISLSGASDLDQVRQGENFYLKAEPLDGAARRILGRPQPLRTVVFAGDAVREIAGPDEDQIAFNAFEPGIASLDIAWGSANRSETIIVVARVGE